jgi:hypothetical protein
VISSEKVLAIPLNGRQFLQLALLSPATNSGGLAVQQNAVRQGEVAGLSVAGQRTKFEQYYDFRERAAIDIYSNQSPTASSADAAVQAAQRLADAACKAWGHVSNRALEPHCIRCGVSAPLRKP